MGKSLVYKVVVFLRCSPLTLLYFGFFSPFNPGGGLKVPAGHKS